MTLVLLMTLTPACFWLWYFYRQDKRPEPAWLVLLAFVGGALAIPPVVAIQRQLVEILPPVHTQHTFVHLCLTLTLAAGVVEEAAKFLVVFLMCRTQHEFDEPVDGLIYAIAVAMGFTAGEDFLRQVMQLDALRMLRPPGHAFFVVFWGYPLGWTVRGGSWWWVVIGLVVAMVVHGMWDVFIYYHGNDSLRAWMPLIVGGVALLLFIGLENRLARAQR